MALADYLHPNERVAVECGRVIATNARLINYNQRSSGLSFREFPYAIVRRIKLSQRPRTTTIVLGALIAALSLLAGPGTLLQMFASGIGVAAILLGIVFGDLFLEVITDLEDAKPFRWSLHEVSRRESQEMVSVIRAAMRGEYDPAPPPPPSPLAPGFPGRSVLLLPADDPALALEALAGNADVVCLDLTHLVHPARRAYARELLRSSIAVAARANRRVWVRVNTDEAVDDLAACVWPGLSAVVTTAESPQAVRRLEAHLASLEQERGTPEQVRMVVQVETALGVLALHETLTVTPRVCAVVVATHDTLDLPGKPDARSTWTTLRTPALPEQAHLRGRIAAVAAETHTPMLASLGTSIAPGYLYEALGSNALDRLSEATHVAQAHAYRGAVTLHQEAIGPCNTTFPAALRISAPPPSSPSKWQPVVPSHFGIGVPTPAPENKSEGAIVNAPSVQGS